MGIEVVEERLERLTGEAPVGQDYLAGLDEVVIDFQQGPGHLAFVEFRVARHQLTGMPSTVVTRYRCMPQK